MSFDISAAVEAAAAAVPSQIEQIQSGDHNGNESCVPTTFLTVMAALGYQVPRPQLVTDVELGPLYHGPEYFWTSLTFIIDRPDLFPDPPDVEIPYPDPGVDAMCAMVDQAGQQGQACVVGFWISCATVVIAPGPLDCGHASIPIAHVDGQSWDVWNVWAKTVQRLTEDEFRAAYAGGAAVFHRSLTTSQQGDDDMTPDQDNLLRAIANEVLADPGYSFGASPGDPSSPYFPGTANAWRWKWSDWYRDQHPELNLPAGPQSGACPAGARGLSWQWGWADSIEAAAKSAEAADLAQKTYDLVKAGEQGDGSGSIMQAINANVTAALGEILKIEAALPTRPPVVVAAPPDAPAIPPASPPPAASGLAGGVVRLLALLAEVLGGR